MLARVMETAKLAFGEAQPMNEVRGGPYRSEDPKRYEGLLRLLATQPPHLAEGEMAVIRPQGNSGFAVVGKIRVEDWPLLQ
jgi:hypothetical protein